MATGTRGRGRRQQSPSPDRDIGMQGNTKLENANLIHLIPEIYGTGNENLDHIFAQARNIAEIAGWSELQFATIFKTRLKGPAYEYLSRSKTLINETDIDEIQRILKERFEQKKSLTQLQLAFQNIVQGENQDLEELALLIENTAHEFLGSEPRNKEILNKIKLSKFLQAVRVDIRRELIKLDLKDFRQAVQKAREIESLLIEQFTDLDFAINRLHISNNNNEIQMLHERIKQLEAEVKNKNNRHPIVCQACFRNNHTIENCHLLRQFRSNRNAQLRQNSRNYAEQNTHNVRQDPPFYSREARRGENRGNWANQNNPRQTDGAGNHRTNHERGSNRHLNGTGGSQTNLRRQ